MTGKSCWWSLADVSGGVRLFSLLAEEAGVGSVSQNLQEGSSTGSRNWRLEVEVWAVSASEGYRLTLLLFQRETGLQYFILVVYTFHCAALTAVLL